MKAIRTHAIGGPETLTLDEVETPTPGKGEVLVAVKACAINYPDGLIIRDMYQFKPQRPYAPGGEIAGVIEAVGEGVEGYSVGDRVLATEAQPYDLQFLPRAAESIPENARILAVADGMLAGPRIVVALNVGARDGIRNGHVFSIWHEGAVRPDNVFNTNKIQAKADKAAMPDDFVGNLMVFRTFDKVSLALILDAKRAIHVGDVARKPE